MTYIVEAGHLKVITAKHRKCKIVPAWKATNGVRESSLTSVRGEAERWAEIVNGGNYCVAAQFQNCTPTQDTTP